MSDPGAPPLIGLAHGSRHAGVGPAVSSVLDRVATAGIEVRSAFLDLTEPDLAQVSGELAEAGHRTAVVVPLLFTAAFHAEVDVPDAVREAATSSGLDLRLADILGTGDDVAAAVVASMAAAGIGPDTSVLLFAVGSSRPSANAAVADLAAHLGSGRGGVVRVGFGTAEPRAEAVLEELARTGRPVAVVPLFLSPGLLLDPLVRLGAERGWRVAAPLGALMADVVLERYRAAVSTAA